MGFCNGLCWKLKWGLRTTLVCGSEYLYLECSQRLFWYRKVVIVGCPLGFSTLPASPVQWFLAHTASELLQALPWWKKTTLQIVYLHIKTFLTFKRKWSQYPLNDLVDITYFWFFFSFPGSLCCGKTNAATSVLRHLHQLWGGKVPFTFYCAENLLSPDYPLDICFKEKERKGKEKKRVER